jgi:hypothetical protein
MSLSTEYAANLEMKPLRVRSNLDDDDKVLLAYDCYLLYGDSVKIYIFIQLEPHLITFISRLFVVIILRKNIMLPPIIGPNDKWIG